MTRLTLRPLLFLGAVLLLDCAALERFPTNACGNGVVEGTEDCDSFPSDRCTDATAGANACRLRCSKDLACPDGWLCAINGFCRALTGQLNEDGDPFSAATVGLFTGDFDGDGRKDIVGTGAPRDDDHSARLKVHYLDDKGLLAGQVVLPSQLISPVPIDVNQDGVDDLAFGRSLSGGLGGLGVLSGLSDRTFLSVLFPSVSLPGRQAHAIFVATTGPIMQTGRPNAILLVQRSAESEGEIVSFDQELIPGITPYKRPLGVTFEQLKGQASTGRLLFDAPAPSECGEVYFVADSPSTGEALFGIPVCTSTASKVIPNQKGIPVVTPFADWNAAAPTMTMKLAPGQKLGGGGVRIADLDGDGDLDILIDGSQGASNALLWAENDAGKALKPIDRFDRLNAFPLAVGNVDNRGSIDFVTRNAILVDDVSKLVDAGADAGDGGTDIGERPVAAVQSEKDWVDARIAYLNNDLFPDVVIQRKESPDLEIFMGSGNGTFTKSTLTTGGVVLLIATGDFDGDRIADVAFFQRGPTQTYDLAISYGRAVGPPEQPKLVGRSGRIPTGISGVPAEGSAIDDIAYYAQVTEGKNVVATEFTRVFGSGDRQSVAPVLYADSRADKQRETLTPRLQRELRVWSPTLLLPGKLSPTSTTDLLTYAVGRRITFSSVETPLLLGAWLSESSPTAQGGIVAPHEVALLDNLPVVDQRGALTSATTVGDIDNDGTNIAELVALAQTGADTTAFIVDAGPGNASRLPARFTISGRRIAAYEPMALVDLDGDGFRDLVALFDRDSNDPKKSRVFVYLNDKKHGFDPNGIPVDIAGATGFAAVITGAAGATAAPKKVVSLAVATKNTLSVVTLDAAARRFVLDEKKQPSFKKKGKDGGPQDITAVTAGDFNGDGVEDLAVADAGALRVLLQKGARARE